MNGIKMEIFFNLWKICFITILIVNWSKANKNTRPTSFGFHKKKLYIIYNYNSYKYYNNNYNLYKL